MKSHIAWLFVFFFSFGTAAWAQSGQTPDDPVAKQQQARQNFQELQDLMVRLATRLNKSEPENARTLQLGTRLVQEKQVEAAMAKATKLMQEQNWDGALEVMREVRGDLTKLLNLLLNRDIDLKELLEEIERLEEFAKRVDELIEEQEKEKSDSAEVEALQKHLEELAQAKREIENLIQRQLDVRDETNQLGTAAEPKKAEQLAGREGALKNDTESLAKKLGQLERKSERLQNRADAKDGDAKGGSQGEPADPKDGDPKAGEPKSGEPKDGEPKDGQPKDGSPSGGSPSSGSGSSGSAGKASQSMGKAQSKLNQNQAEGSLDDMEQALEELGKAKEALEELEAEAQRRLKQLPFEELAKKQESTMAKTDKLAEDMQKSGEGKGKEGEEGTPGTKNVELAVPKQKNAAGSLKEYKPAKAKPEQQDAEDQLKEAKKKLEDALAQLRQQLQDEVLRALEERFTAMLAKQKEISQETKVTDRRKNEALTSPGELPASLQSKCGELGEGESELAMEAGLALKLLEDEASTAVFPEIVADLERELHRVSGMLKEFETSRRTQLVQLEIEEMLQDLIDALRRAIEMNDSQGNCSNCNGESPLVPLSAELKMIRAQQKRVNRRTKQYDEDIPVALRGTEDGKVEAKVISEKQSRVEDLTRKLATKLNKDENAGGGQ